jgi:hypothetical protein
MKRSHLGYDTSRIVLKKKRALIVDQGPAGFAFVQENAWAVRDPRLTAAFTTDYVFDEPIKLIAREPEPEPEGYKRCRLCGELKPHTEFSQYRVADSSSPEQVRLHSYCKACRASQRRRKYAAKKKARDR